LPLHNAPEEKQEAKSTDRNNKSRVPPRADNEIDQDEIF
jgi:hypothetical protein